MNKKYILYTRIKDNKYENFYRQAYKIFDNYYELQKHLNKFWFIEKNNYIIFEETDITRDYSCSDTKRGRL